MEPIPTMDNRLNVAFFIRDNATKDAEFMATTLVIVQEIEKRMIQIKEQLCQLEEEQNSKITSENIFKEGFNKTVNIIIITFDTYLDCTIFETNFRIQSFCFRPCESICFKLKKLYNRNDSLPNFKSNYPYY